MIESKFSRDEINTMIEAMDAWLGRNHAHELMMQVFKMTNATSPEDAKKAFEEYESRNTTTKEQKEKEQEVSTIIKAKLISLKKTSFEKFIDIDMKE